MSQAALDAAITRYYTDQTDEDSRLQRHGVSGVVEFQRVQRLVTRRLPAPARVLDVGGATGVHSRWLAASGHQVTLVDPVPAHIERASADGSYAAVLGDVRRLPQDDASVDAVLLLGPLYHLASSADRLRALRESARVLTRGGLIFAQGIGRLAALADETRRAGFEALSYEDLQTLRTGEWTNTAGGFPGGHFHVAAELRSELLTAGFTEVRVHGIEGPTVGTLELVPADADLVSTTIDLVERVEAALAGDAALLDAIADASPHLLGIARKP